MTKMQNGSDPGVDPDVREALIARILAGRSKARASQDEIRPRDPGGHAPLSYSQERLWFIDRLEGGQSREYNMTHVIPFPKEVDRPGLERALDQIIRRHDVFRTTIATDDRDHPYQVIHDHAPFELAVDDLRGVPAAGALARKTTDTLADQPFDLEQGPVYRFRLLLLDHGASVLVMVIHHIAFDGWSLGLFDAELREAYHAAVQGREPQLPSLPIQYADYASWQRQRMESGGYQAKFAYWTERLEGARALELSTDRPRPERKEYGGGSWDFVLEPSIHDRLVAIAHEQDATTFMAVLAGFKVLLSKYTGTNDILVGAPVAGRGRPEVSNLIGFLVNLVVLRTDVRCDLSFRELLGRVRESCLGAYQNDEVPFERLVSALNPDLRTGQDPFVRVLFQSDEPLLRGSDVRSKSEPGSMKFQPLDSGVLYDLELVMAGIDGQLRFDGSIFDKETVRHMVVHLKRVLALLGKHPDIPISSLDLIDDEERALADRFNATSRFIPRDKTLCDLIEAGANEDPDELAVIHGQQEVTFAELHASAAHASRALAARGVGPGTRVALCAPVDIAWVATLLGLWHLGAVAVPLGDALDADALGRRLKEAEVSLRIGGVATGVPFDAPEVLSPASLLAIHEMGTMRAPVDPCALQLDPTQPACIVYDDGAAPGGTPAGIVWTHRNLVNVASALPLVADVGPGDRVVGCDTAPGATLVDLFGALANGATAVLATSDCTSDGAALHAELLRTQASTVFTSVDVLGSMPRSPLPAVTHIVVRGPHLDGADAAYWGQDRTLVHAFSAYETTTIATSYRWRESPSATVPVGRPIANMRAWVLDATGRLLPPYMPGTLCLAGEGLGQEQEQPLASGGPGSRVGHFIPAPEGLGQEQRLFSTGRWARWRPDGSFEILDTTRDQGGDSLLKRAAIATAHSIAGVTGDGSVREDSDEGAMVAASSRPRSRRSPIHGGRQASDVSGTWEP